MLFKNSATDSIDFHRFGYIGWSNARGLQQAEKAETDHSLPAS
jgi:hypothetical protein